MTLIRKLFSSKQDPLNERADTLVYAAHISAVNSFKSFLDRFQFLRDIHQEAWDFFVIVAIVFMGATRLNNLQIDENREDKLMEIVAERLDEWNKSAIQSFEDCKQFFESEFDRLTQVGHDSSFIASDSVGKWIALNILERPPESDEECLFVRTIGAMVTHVAFDWWREGEFK